MQVSSDTQIEQRNCNAPSKSIPLDVQLLTRAPRSYDNFRFHMETNVIGPIICAQKLVSLNPDNPPSKLIFISSDSGSAANFLAYEDGFAAYAASKAALNQMLRHMAQELKRRGGRWAEICVLALHPGEVHT